MPDKSVSRDQFSRKSLGRSGNDTSVILGSPVVIGQLFVLSVEHWKVNFSSVGQWPPQLRDLIARRQVGVKVVLPVEGRGHVDLGTQG